MPGFCTRTCCSVCRAVDFLRHAQCGPGLGPACVKSSVGEKLGHFHSRYAVLFCVLNMMLQRTVENSAGHQSRHCDDAAVAGGKLFLSRPDLPEQHIVVQLCEFWCKNAHGVPSCRYFFNHTFLLLFFRNPKMVHELNPDKSIRIPGRLCPAHKLFQPCGYRCGIPCVR